MNTERIKQILLYALVIASKEDRTSDRELGPIHLIKYAYLADLGYAASTNGQTFTGAHWRFHHYGPWAVEVFEAVNALQGVSEVDHKAFPSRYDQDVHRYSIPSSVYLDQLETRLESELPLSVTRAIRRSVRHHCKDTEGLLHDVYNTPPMLKAAPSELLNFDWAIQEKAPLDVQTQPQTATLTHREKKRRKESHDSLKKRFQEKLHARMAREAAHQAEYPTQTPVNTDEIHAWVQRLEGEPLEPFDAEVTFADDWWRSPARGGHDIS